ncbi:MAG: hypothetical protein ABW084_09530 [Candidatus Thiodiazotropha sp.]
MSIEKFVKRLNEVGLDVTQEEHSLIIAFETVFAHVEIGEDWEREIRGYYRSRLINYEEQNRIFWTPKAFERPIGRLNQTSFNRLKYEFTGNRSGKVVFNRASKKFCLAFLESDEYPSFFENIITRRLKRTRMRVMDTIEGLLWRPNTVRYELSSNTDKSTLFDKANKAISSCLFKLAHEKGECWEPLKKKKRLVIDIHEDDNEDELIIPLAVYDENLVRYYKVARSSQFSSQAFLAFYHILEYNFLRVTDEVLYNKIRGQINNTEFRPSHKHIDRLISTISSHKEQSDETEMLRSVLQKYIDEEELIEFIEKIEKESKQTIYTKSRIIFGDKFSVSPKQGHALSNSAKVIKHIRNALVHSSDRYSREDCHIPLTESEEIVSEFVPLVRFMAEKIIFSSASGSS